MNMLNQKLVEVKGLKKYFKSGKRDLKAVDNISFDIYKGETLGLVGESGCGKSTVGRTIMNLYHATDGEVLYSEHNIQNVLSKKEQRYIQKNIQMIFQDPYSSLNPRKTVLDIVSEGIHIHFPHLSKKEQKERVYELLEQVGLSKAHAARYPHEFSGGQRQRIGIARALAVNPKFIIADEPIAALDVSIQAEVVNLLKQLQQQHLLTYLFIAHDLSMIKYISDRIAVMYLGKLVELASSEDLYNNPLHPYTEALLSAIPVPDPKTEREREQIILKGDLPSPIDPPSGCPFRTRCPMAMEICAQEMPEWKEKEDGHFIACHLH